MDHLIAILYMIASGDYNNVVEEPTTPVVQSVDIHFSKVSLLISG